MTAHRSRVRDLQSFRALAPGCREWLCQAFARCGVEEVQAVGGDREGQAFADPDLGR